MVELVDAVDSKSTVRKDVGVRLSLGAPPYLYADGKWGRCMTEDHGHYQVGLKALFRRGDEFLFLKSPLGNTFDFPGGRILKKESDTPLKDILRREITEELGQKVKYTIKGPAFQFRRFFKQLNIRVFITVYEVEYISGQIELSQEHATHHWINPLEYSFEKRNFLTLEEYKAFTAYMQNCHVGLQLS